MADSPGSRATFEPWAMPVPMTTEARSRGESEPPNPELSWGLFALREVTLGIATLGGLGCHFGAFDKLPMGVTTMRRRRNRGSEQRQG